MDMKVYGKRLRNRIYVLCSVAGINIVIAAWMLGAGMWLKSLFLALFGTSLFMTALGLGSESENRTCLFFVLSIFFVASSLAVFAYGLYCWIF